MPLVKNIEKGFDIEVDVAVVGSGPGGAVFAKEVSERGFSVAVLEEGDFIKSDDLPLSRSERPLLAFKLLYRNAGMTAAFGLPGHPPIPLPLGRCVGGSSVINSGTCFRLPEDVVFSWRDYGIKISYDELSGFFESVEEELNISEVSDDLLGNHGRLFLSAAKRLGMEGGAIRRNAKDCKGCGLCQFLCPEDAKLSMHLTYIPKAISFGTYIFTKCRVNWIMVQDGVVQGVQGDVLDDTDKPKAKFRVGAKVVALACGSIYTPFLLLKNRLCNFSGQVGKNLTIHPGLRVTSVFPESERIEQWKGVPQGYYVSSFKREGIMIEGISVPPIIGAMTLPYVGSRYKNIISRYTNILSVGIMVSDSSRGRVFAFRKEPFTFYNLSKKDAERFLKGVFEVSKILFEAGAEKVFPHVYGLDEINSPDDIKILKNYKAKPSCFELLAFHPLGTCRMGNKESNSVVNQNLESHDIKNLFIVDGSVFPTPLGVNPQETIMAFSKRAGIFVSENKLSK